MGLSFNYPFELGDSNGAIKSDIAQLQQDVGDLSQLETADKSSLVNALNEAIDSTLNGVNRDLSNLSDLGNDKLRSLNSYANYGELLADADGLSFVQKYAHSTFDLSKFTVVGSPNITDDGIASGFSSSNYIQTPDFLLGNYSSWAIPIYGKLPLSSTTFYDIGTNTSAIRCGCIHGNPNYVIRLEFQDNTSSQNFVNIFNHFGQTYNGTLQFTGSKYIATLNFSNGTTEIIEIENNSPIKNGSIVYGYGTLLTSIDLKGVNITANGVEVFSGNKTGIDTIKPDNYTVVGAPTISADGVASGFSDSNYLQATIPALTNATNFEIKAKFIIGAIPSSSYSVILADNSGANYGLSIWTYNSTKLTVRCNAASNHLVITDISQNDNIDILLKTVSSTSAYCLCYKNGTKVYDGNIDISTMQPWTNKIDIGNRSADANNSYFTGSIDLNAFKIYVDGDLVYQPCLKIPYTESKTGSKIVDSIYRDRVNDMAEQFGFANYYTLSDTDFTLPQVELYGLIGQRTLRDSYYNGINYWELYSNRDLEQGGSCTSGVEVTFARPFTDTNYVLSVPYSAKSATAFTPTQTGDWIAKGKGIL